MSEHLSPEDLACHHAGVLRNTELTRADEHLAECAACRSELIALSRVLRSTPRRRRWYLPAGAAAAAAVALLLLWPTPPDQAPNYREPAVSATPAPVGLAPRGPTAAPVRLVWTHVPHVTRYRLTVFDSTGTVIWESQTRDTAASPAGLRPRVRYFWQVAAETGFDRWIRSDMMEFVIQP